jgi:glycosyltransferase involved in cell wall biosynthesis
MRYSNISATLEKQLNNQDYDLFINSVLNFYTKEIKSNEDPVHYENCFNEINPYLEKYGRIVKNQLPKIKKNNRIRICYILPNLDSDLAHIEVLYSILKNHTNLSNIEIYIAGQSSSPTGCQNKLITKLSLENNIKIINFSHTHKGLINFFKLFIEEKFSQLIILSIPILLPLFIRALGSDYVTWHTLKFALNCFENLKNGICGYSSIPEIPSNTKWYKNNSVLNEPYKWNYEFQETNVIKFISINREEKIKNITFLEAIKKILIAIPKSTFDWTGRNNDDFINSYFEEAGLINRVKFIGWVDPLSILKNYDIFLDTPNLSGIVAASAFSAGMPVIFFRNSRSWVTAYSEKLNVKIYESNLKNFTIADVLSNDVNEFVINTEKIANDAMTRKSRIQNQKLICQDYFFDSIFSYSEHINIIKNISEPNLI